MTDDRSKILNPQSKISADRGHLLTEQRNDATAALDALDTASALRAINAQDKLVAEAVEAAVPAIAGLVDAVVAGMRRGGRLVYIGAGTSGRLGVLDASEIPPTFQAPAGRVIGIIAGGDGALRVSSEGKEDDPRGAWPALDELGLTDADTLVGIAAGGTTPYVWGGIDYAKQRGATTGFLTCVRLDDVPQAKEIGVDHGIELLVGPEVVTGSTRMKAGTATKLALNMISTLSMVRLGKTWGNLMIDVKASNAKLRDRAVRVVQSQTDLSRDEALAALDRADGGVKLAIVMTRLGLDADAARARIEEHHGQVRPILGDPR
ncbi:MAG: N-acetylmuramic acid 6-phosphate etherase [Planctomycetota bacterium]